MWITLTQASNACSSMSVEHQWLPSPSVAGCSPARVIPDHVLTAHVMPGVSNVP